MLNCSNIAEHGRYNYLVRPTRKRKFEGKTPEELLAERNEYLKLNIDLAKTMEKMTKDWGELEEIKEKYHEQNRTLAELFDKGIIDGDGQINPEFMS